MAISIEKVESKQKPERTERKPFKLSPGFVIAIAIVGSLLLSALVLFLYVWPQWNRVGLGKEFDNEALLRDLRSKEQVHQQLKALRANLESIPEEQLETIGVILPQQQLVPELMNQLETVARTSGVNLASVNITEVQEADTRSARQRLQQPNAASANSGVKTLRIQIDITAFRYQNFERFIENLQANARIMDIQRLTFRSDSETHTVFLHTYYLPE